MASNIKATVRGNMLILHIPLTEHDNPSTLFKQPCWPGWLNAHYKGKRLQFTGHVSVRADKAKREAYHERLRAEWARARQAKELVQQLQ